MNKQDIVYAFSKTSDRSTVASGRLAQFVAETFKLPLYHDGRIAEANPRILFMVNGPPLYALGHLDVLGEAIIKADLVVWVQNDYTTPVPARTNTKVASPFWRAFAIRNRDKKPLIAWSTLRDGMPEGSVYTNWNKLTYEEREPRVFNGIERRCLLYYGAFRNGRRKGFRTYLMGDSPALYGVHISSTSQKFADMIKETGSCAVLIPPFRRSEFYDRLGIYGFGMFLEDEASHTHYHSPPNRFYEMLGAGLPMLFQEETGVSFQDSGYDIDAFKVGDPEQIAEAFKYRKTILREQLKWRRDYLAELKTEAKRAYRNIIKQV